MTPDPVDLVAEALVERGLAIDPEATRDDATAALNALRAQGLEIVRFAAGVDHAPGHGVTVERWPGDDSHLRRST